MVILLCVMLHVVSVGLAVHLWDRPRDRKTRNFAVVVAVASGLAITVLTCPPFE